MSMTQDEKRLFEARKKRFAAKARADSFANRLSSAGVTNEGSEHDSDEMIARSKRAGKRIFANIVRASLEVGRR